MFQQKHVFYNVKQSLAGSTLLMKQKNSCHRRQYNLVGICIAVASPWLQQNHRGSMYTIPHKPPFALV